MEDLVELNHKIDELCREVAKIQVPKTGKWLRTKVAAEYLGISETQLHNFKREGVLPYSKLGGSLYFRRNDIDQILEENLQEVR